MTNAQHTPGPWGLETALSSDLYNIRYVTGPDCQKICDVNHRVEMTQGEALANARLIVMAPVMLYWLGELSGHVGHYAAMQHAHPDAHKHAANARAVVAKATGVWDPQIPEPSWNKSDGDMLAALKSLHAYTREHCAAYRNGLPESVSTYEIVSKAIEKNEGMVR